MALSSSYAEEFLTTLKAKEPEAAASSQAPTPTQPVEVPATQSTTLPTSPDTKYCAINTLLRKICCNEYPMFQTGMKISKNKKGKSGNRRSNGQ